MGLIRSFLGSRSGNFGLTFALATVPIMIAIGCSFDYVMAVNTHRKMQQDLDAALVAAVNAVGTKDNDALKMEIGHWLEAEAEQKGYYVLNTGGIEIDTTNSTIKASVSAIVPTTFLKIANITSVPVTVTSAVLGGKNSTTKNAFSMYLVLDRSGSMDEATTTTYTTTCYTNTRNKTGAYQCTKNYTKIESLKLATNDLMTQLATADPDMKYVRTGAVSYNSSMQSPQSLGWGEADVLTYVQALTATGGTSSTDAFKNAYNSLIATSEATAHKNMNGQVPSKYIVFMTDGDNNYTSDDTATKSWCDKARTAKITVYTIAFMAPDKGQALLKYCATTIDNYFPAENTAQLVSAFKLIGETSSKTLTRLTQ